MKRYILTALALVAIIALLFMLSTCSAPRENAEVNPIPFATANTAPPTVPAAAPHPNPNTPEPTPEPFEAIVARTGSAAGSILVNREPISAEEIAIYETLKARMPSLSDIDEAARMAWGEARGLSSNAWIAVTWVVINRWQSGNWDYRNCETVFDVLTQRIGGGVQFSGYSAGYPVTEEIHNAVINAFADFAEGKDDPTGGALFFNGFGNKIVTWTSYEDFNHLDKGQTWK